MNNASPWAPPSSVVRPDPTPKDDDDVVPYLDIWFRPAPTMRWILKKNPLMGLLPILAIHGFVTLKTTGLELPFDLAARLVFGPLAAALSVAILALAALLVGRMFNGEGSFLECFSALVWGGLPSTAASVVGFGGALVMVGTGEFGLVGLVALGVVVLGWLWGFVWQVVTVAEAHRFGWFESAVTVAAPYLLWLGCLGMLFAAVAGMAV